MFKTIILALLFSSPLLFTQCKSAGTTQLEDAQQTNKKTQNMEKRNPAFAKANTIYQRWSAGIQEGGFGFSMQFGWSALPENLVMKEAYFRGMKAKILQNEKGYLANFTSGANGPKDIVMHSDPVKEAVNTPPAKESKFPEALTDTQVGIVYEENGQLVYTILENLTETPEIALPQAPPSNGLPTRGGY